MFCKDCGEPCAWQFERCYAHRLIHRAHIQTMLNRASGYVARSKGERLKRKKARLEVC